VSVVARIIQADVIDGLRSLPDASVHCIVTSPPYWGLRDYGVPGQLGLEKTPEEYLARMVEVFREARRVLRDDGTAWCNLGDSYAGSGCGWGGGSFSEKSGHFQKIHGDVEHKNKDQTPPPGLKPKDLCGIPWRLALALQADGWYLRCDIIWAKPNPMPESVTDRPTRAHEYIFLLSKSARYYYDAEAIMEPVSENTHARISQDLAKQIGSFRANGGGKTNGPMKAVVKGSTRKMAEAGSGIKHNDSYETAMALKVSARNKRTVWAVPSAAFKDAHFATFSPKLIEPCILAGCPRGGTVLDPFVGSGTTCAVAKALGRNSIGIELNPKYVAMAERRVARAEYQLALELGS